MPAIAGKDGYAHTHLLAHMCFTNMCVYTCRYEVDIGTLS